MSPERAVLRLEAPRHAPHIKTVLPTTLVWLDAVCGSQVACCLVMRRKQCPAYQRRYARCYAPQIGHSQRGLLRGILV